MTGIRSDRLKQEVEQNITDRTLSGLDSGVATQDDDGTGAKSAHQKAHGGKGKQQGKHGVDSHASGAGASQTSGLDRTAPPERRDTRNILDPQNAADRHPQRADGARDDSARLSDTDKHADAFGEIDDFAADTQLSGSAPKSTAGTAARGRSNDTGADGLSRRLAGGSDSAASDTSSEANPSTQNKTTQASSSTPSTTSAATDAASQATPTDGTTPSQSAANTPASDPNAASASSTDSSASTGSTSSAATPLTLTDESPAVQKAEKKLIDDLHDKSTDPKQIDEDTDKLIAALKAEDREGEAAGIIDQITQDPTADLDLSARALVEAIKNGINMDDSGKDKAASAKTQSAIDRSNALKQKQEAEQARQAAEQAQQAQQAAQQQASHQSSDSGGGSKNSGTSGTGGSNSGGGNTVNSGAVEVPPGTKANTPSYGTAVPWESFKQKSYGSPTPFNNEEETYTTDGSNFKIDADGNAVLTAKPNGPNGAYTSGRIEGNAIGSLPKYVEFNAQMPSGQGMWPALWLCGPDWPTHGEVDISEQVGNEKQNHMSTHWGAEQGNSTHNTQQPVNMSDRDTAFHRYGAMLTDTGVQFYLDGKKVGDPVTMPGDWKNYAPTLSPVINLAVGGWGGKSDPSVGEKSLVVKGMSVANTPPDEGGES